MKKILMVVVTAVLLIFLVHQGSIAFFHAETQLGAKVSAGNLGIKLVETNNDPNVKKEENGYQITSVMPGEEIESTVHIENVKDNSLYVRVTATKFWEDSKGNKLVNADASMIKFQNADTQNWLVIDDADNSNGEVVYFYYKKPIKANEVSTNMINKVLVDHNLKDQAYGDYQIKVSYEAEAVQSVAGKDAALNEWGIDMEIDNNGNIVSIKD